MAGSAKPRVAQAPRFPTARTRFLDGAHEGCGDTGTAGSRGATGGDHRVVAVDPGSVTFLPEGSETASRYSAALPLRPPIQTPVCSAKATTMSDAPSFPSVG